MFLLIRLLLLFNCFPEIGFQCNSKRLHSVIYNTLKQLLYIHIHTLVHLVHNFKHATFCKLVNIQWVVIYNILKFKKNHILNRTRWPLLWFVMARMTGHSVGVQSSICLRVHAHLSLGWAWQTKYKSLILFTMHVKDTGAVFWYPKNPKSWILRT